MANICQRSIWKDTAGARMDWLKGPKTLAHYNVSLCGAQIENYNDLQHFYNIYFCYSSAHLSKVFSSFCLIGSEFNYKCYKRQRKPKAE